jgi:CrcB protein
LIFHILAISLGAALGALLRWQLGVWLNAAFPHVPPGTLVANLLGGYLIGVALGYFAQHPELSPAWRLFVMTGFLGGLTTFSTFSAEVVSNLMAERWGAALAGVGVHLGGSLALTALGIATVMALRQAPAA